MLLTLDTPAAAWPVTEAEAQRQLRLDDSNTDSDLLALLISVATASVSEYVGKDLAEQVWTASWRSVSGEVPLPRGPVKSLDAISYYDADGNAQSADVSDFYLFADDDTASVKPKPNAAWPTTQDRQDAISITFTTGYTNVPPHLKQAVLLMISHLHGRREPVARG